MFIYPFGHIAYLRFIFWIFAKVVAETEPLVKSCGRIRHTRAPFLMVKWKSSFQVCCIGCWYLTSLLPPPPLTLSHSPPSPPSLPVSVVIGGRVLWLLGYAASVAERQLECEWVEKASKYEAIPPPAGRSSPPAQPHRSCSLTMKDERDSALCCLPRVKPHSLEIASQCPATKRIPFYCHLNF